MEPAASPTRVRAATPLRVAAVAVAAALLAGAAPARAVEPGPPGRSLVHSVQVGGKLRSYRMFAPASLARDRPAPLVLVFHGGGGTPRQIERESRFSERAAKEGFVVAYPEGHRRSWNDGRGAAAVAAQRDEVDDIAFVAAVIDDVAARHPIDPKRIFATGISNGAMFSHRLALHLAPRIAAIAPVAGGLPEPLAKDFGPQDRVSVLLINGTDDPLVPYAGGEVTVFGSRRGRVAGTDVSAATWAGHNRCEANQRVEELADRDPDDGCRATHFVYRGCALGYGVEVYRLNGAGHTWPGGSQYLRERLVGKVCREFNGAAVIWDFFRRHPKP